MSFREQMMTRVRVANDLPTLPVVAAKIASLVSDPDSSASDIARVMEHDPALTARVLRVSNSAAFGGASRITSVSSAVARLGMRDVHDIALSMSVLGLFKTKTFLDYSKFWKHSLSVAFATQVMRAHAAKVPKSHADDTLFTAGILHDIGVFIMVQYAEKIYQHIVTTTGADDLDLFEKEQSVLGITHAEVGSLLLERWHLPDSIVSAVRYHHAPGLAPESSRLATRLVHLANFACNNQGIDNGLSVFPSKFSESAWFEIGLNVEDIPGIIDEVNRMAAKSEVMIAVAGETA